MYAEFGDDVFANTTNYVYGDSTWADLLTSYGSTNITYDELGNPLNWYGGRTGRTLSWQNGRQLASVVSGTNTYSYTYNADGLRASKSTVKSGNVTKNTEYYIVNGQYIGEVTTIGDESFVIAYVYDENGAPAGINVNNIDYYFAKNLQGDIVAILNDMGAVEVKYTYDAWGDIVSITNGEGVAINATGNETHIAYLNPFRYRGYMYDEETDFYYLRSRYYDPAVGRFLNADGLVSTGQGLDGNNMFAYCGNNPVMRVDPSGQFWTPIVAIVAVIAVVAIVTKKVNNVLKEKNYKNNAKLDNNSSTTTYNDLINKQSDSPVTSFEYGVDSGNKNTCEAIAIHNAKVLNGVDSTLTNTIEDVQNQNGMMLFGKWGTNPYAIDEVVENSGLSCVSVDLADMTVPGTYIISYWNDPISRGIHTVTAYYDGSAYTVYNTGANTRDGGPVVWDSLDRYENSFICGYYVGD